MPYLANLNFRYGSGTGYSPTAHSNAYSNDCVEFKTPVSAVNALDYSGTVFQTFAVHDFPSGRGTGLIMPFAGSSPSDLTGLAQHYAHPVNVVDSDSRAANSTYCIVQALVADVNNTTPNTPLMYMKIDAPNKSVSNMTWTV